MDFRKPCHHAGIIVKRVFLAALGCPRAPRHNYIIKGLLMKIIASALSTMLLATVFAPTAQALNVLSTTGTGPAGNCAPAFPPGGLTALRQRPLATINEGPAIEYVTCAFTTEEISLGVVDFNTRITNLSDVTAVVNCTAVVGEESLGPEYFVKSITVAPMTSGTLAWTGSDNGGLLFSKSVAISCALPTFVGVNRNRVTVLLSIL